MRRVAWRSRSLAIFSANGLSARHLSSASATPSRRAPSRDGEGEVAANNRSAFMHYVRCNNNKYTRSEEYSHEAGGTAGSSDGLLEWSITPSETVSPPNRKRGPSQPTAATQRPPRGVQQHLLQLVDRQMSRGNARRIRSELFQAMANLRRGESELRRRLSMQAPRDSQVPLPGQDAHGDSLYSMEAILFEVCGQMERTLRSLTPAHYAAAAHEVYHPRSNKRTDEPGRTHPDQSGIAAFHLLRRLQRVVELLSALPVHTAGFITTQQMDIHIRATGCLNGIRHLLATLVWSAENKAVQLSVVQLLDMFGASCVLPRESGGVTSVVLRPARSGDARVKEEVRVEEWCVEQLVLQMKDATAHQNGQVMDRRLLSRLVGILRVCLSNHEEDVSMPNSQRGNAFLPLSTSVSSLIIPFMVGQAYTQVCVNLLLQDRHDHHQQLNTHNERLVDELHVRDVAVLLWAILVFEVHTTETAQLLSQAAPMCVDHLHQLRGPELRTLLMAYAKLRYNGADVYRQRRMDANGGNSSYPVVNFYVELGTRAGQIGDSLSPIDAAEILRAMEVAGVEHDHLRRALESCARMRNIFKKGWTTTMG